MNVDNINASHIDVSALKDSLDNAKLQVRLKAQELQKANNEIQTLKEKQKISTYVKENFFIFYIKSFSIILMVLQKYHKSLGSNSETE